MKKKLNWRLVVNDLLSLLAVFWVVFRWETKDDFYKLGGIVLMIYVAVLSIEAHYNHYKKEKRFY